VSVLLPRINDSLLHPKVHPFQHSAKHSLRFVLIVLELQEGIEHFPFSFELEPLDQDLRAPQLDLHSLLVLLVQMHFCEAISKRSIFPLLQDFFHNRLPSSFETVPILPFVQSCLLIAMDQTNYCFLLLSYCNVHHDLAVVTLCVEVCDICAL